MTQCSEQIAIKRNIWNCLALGIQLDVFQSLRAYDLYRNGRFVSRQWYNVIERHKGSLPKFCHGQDWRAPNRLVGDNADEAKVQRNKKIRINIEYKDGIREKIVRIRTKYLTAYLGLCIIGFISTLSAQFGDMSTERLIATTLLLAFTLRMGNTYGKIVKYRYWRDLFWRNQTGGGLTTYSHREIVFIKYVWPAYLAGRFLIFGSIAILTYFTALPGIAHISDIILAVSHIPELAYIMHFYHILCVYWFEFRDELKRKIEMFRPELKAELEYGSENWITNIAAMDNDTIVEAFKYLNYCRLAKTNLVSKRFSNLIRTHRHKLARIYIHSIGMTEDNSDHTGITVFDKRLSPEEYNNWVIHNGYSKQMETQIPGMQSSQNERKVYRLYAYVDYYYKDSKPSYKTQKVLDACTVLNHENWPVFQHYVRLLTDPFTFISSMRLPSQINSLNLLAGAINPNCGRIQCQSLGRISLENNMKDRISWIKDHVHCYDFCIMGPIYPSVLPSNHDEEFLDFFLTGANCTSSIYLKFYEPCKLIARFVQKFMDLKSSDGNKIVGFIECHPNANVNIDILKRDYADFVVEGNIIGTSWLVFEFVNNDIGKKLLLSINFRSLSTEFTLEVASL